MGLGARSVVIILSGSLCVWRSPLEYSGYSLEMSLVFGARLCWGGGGGNVTFRGIQVPREYFIHYCPPVPQGPGKV